MPRFHAATGSYVFRQDWDLFLRELHATEVEIADALYEAWNSDEKYWEVGLERDLCMTDGLLTDVQRTLMYISVDEVQDERERRFLRASEQQVYHARLERDEASAHFSRGEWATAAATTIAAMTHARLALQCLIQLCGSIWTADEGFSDEPRELEHQSSPQSLAPVDQ